MSTPIRIHQIYHGYKRGHQEIAASTKLSQIDSDAVTRLSDLSGTPISGFAFESYLTIYPLPSLTFYALALTRPDLKASRAGCVLTNTLLIEMKDWSTLSAPKEISSLFFATPSIPEKVSPIEYTPGLSLESPERFAVSPEDQDFVGRYFSEGIRPIIWLDQSEPDKKLWAIVTGLWPALRRSFSACTLCLQPRSLQGRMFDVMFAPRMARSRFSRLDTDHFIDSSPLIRESWQNDFAMQLFEGQIVDSESNHLASALDENPSSIRKVFLFRDLWKRSLEQPTAAIGVFDLLDSVNAPEITSQLQKIALNRAASSFSSVSASDRLELFSMLLLRISRVRTESHKQEFFKNLLASVMEDILCEFPKEVVSAIERAWPNMRDDAGLKGAFLAELAAALPGSAKLAEAIAGCADIGKELLIDYTSAFAKALNEPGGRLLAEQTIEWLNETSFRKLLPKFRVGLLAHLKSNRDSPLFGKVLADICEDEVVPILNILFDDDFLAYQNRKVIEVIVDSIARPYPVQTRNWMESSTRRNEIIAHVVSATYPPNATEYREVLSSLKHDPEFQCLVFASWIVQNSSSNSRFIREITDFASHDSTIIDPLIGPGCEGVVENALQMIVESLGPLSSVSEPLLRRILLHQSDNVKLIDLTIRSVITDYVHNGANTESFEALLEEEHFATWLVGGQNWRLATLLKGSISSTESCSRAWEVLNRIPDRAFMRDTLISCIESLLVTTARYWSLATLDKWIKIIRRCRDSSSYVKLEVDLCGQAVRFAFENPHLSTSGLLVEGFSSLYTSVTESRYVPNTAISIFSFWNWDKGSELREALIDRFAVGKWPPGDLGLAVRDFGLLRKLLKRIFRRKGGHSFASKMYTDLISRDDNQSRSLANNIANLLKNGDYYEEWD